MLLASFLCAFAIIGERKERSARLGRGTFAPAGAGEGIARDVPVGSSRGSPEYPYCVGLILPHVHPKSVMKSVTTGQRPQDPRIKYTKTEMVKTPIAIARKVELNCNRRSFFLMSVSSSSVR